MCRRDWQRMLWTERNQSQDLCPLLLARQQSVTWDGDRPPLASLQIQETSGSLLSCSSQKWRLSEKNHTTEKKKKKRKGHISKKQVPSLLWMPRAECAPVQQHLSSVQRGQNMGRHITFFHLRWKSLRALKLPADQILEPVPSTCGPFRYPGSLQRCSNLLWLLYCFFPLQNSDSHFTHSFAPDSNRAFTVPDLKPDYEVTEKTLRTIKQQRFFHVKTLRCP